MKSKFWKYFVKLSSHKKFVEISRKFWKNCGKLFFLFFGMQRLLRPRKMGYKDLGYLAHWSISLIWIYRKLSIRPYTFIWSGYNRTIPGPVLGPSSMPGIHAEHAPHFLRKKASAVLHLYRILQMVVPYKENHRQPTAFPVILSQSLLSNDGQWSIIGKNRLVD